MMTYCDIYNILLSVFNCGSTGSTAKPQIHRKIHHLHQAPNAIVFHLTFNTITLISTLPGVSHIGIMHEQDYYIQCLN